MNNLLLVLIKLFSKVIPRAVLSLLVSLPLAFGSERSTASAASTADGSDLLGTKAPEFSGLTWLNHEPLTLRRLRGKVVLIRFWLIDCSYCSGSAPALNELWNEYETRGLVVLGIHHPKSKKAEDLDVVKTYADNLHFKFPIAADNQWETINSLWLRKQPRSFTSATLLIDKRGIIRWIHPGGLLKLEHNESHSSQFDRLEKEIEILLKQPI